MTIILRGLEERMQGFLGDRSMAFAQDASGWHPPATRSFDNPGFRNWQNRLSGYDILDALRRASIDDDQKVALADYIRDINTSFLRFIEWSFRQNPNLFFPATVKEELETWIERSEISNYKRWRHAADASERYFESDRRHRVFSGVSGKGALACLDAQYKFLSDLHDVLLHVPVSQVPKSSDLMLSIQDYLTRTKGELTNDHRILAETIALAVHKGYHGLRLATLDPHLAEAAAALFGGPLRGQLYMEVVSGYSLMTPSQNGSRIIVDGFKTLYRSDAA